MSLTLLKKSLEILEDYDDDASKAPVSRKNASQKRGKKHNRQKPTKTIEKKTVQDIKSEIKDNMTKMELNVRRLLALSQNSLKNADAEKIIKHTCKGRTMEKEETPVEQTSIFTEEDFAKFEKEYFGS